MKITEQTVKIVTYASEVHPEITTDNESLSSVISWADANPVVWDIVMGTKSAPFGRESSHYMGCQRGKDPQSALSRAATFKRDVENTDVPATRDEPFWQWRARFTLEHYKDKGFKGGFFQQYDGWYERGCCDLDYTHGTVKEVIAKFVKWCGSTYETKAVWIDKKTVWTVEP